MRLLRKTSVSCVVGASIHPRWQSWFQMTLSFSFFFCLHTTVLSPFLILFFLHRFHFTGIPYIVESREGDVLIDLLTKLYNSWCTYIVFILFREFGRWKVNNLAVERRDFLESPLPLTPEFVRNIRLLGRRPTTQMITDNLIRKYGTHFLLSATLGGK